MCSFGPRKDRKIMKLALFGLVTAALLALGSGCSICCGPFEARPGSGCDTAFAESLWRESCDTTHRGGTGPVTDFGNCNAGCATNYQDCGCSYAAEPVPQPLFDNMQNGCANGFCGQEMGPTQGSVQYPYYTTRGPRDFLLANPPSIGP